MHDSQTWLVNIKPKAKGLNCFSLAVTLPEMLREFPSARRNWLSIFGFYKTTTTTTTIFIRAQKLHSIDLNTRDKKIQKKRAQPLRNSKANRAKWLGQAERNLLIRLLNIEQCHGHTIRLGPRDPKRLTATKYWGLGTRQTYHMKGRVYLRMDGGAITWQPNFFRLMGYQVF